MAVLRRTLVLLAASSLLHPTAGMHGFMDSLLHGHSSQATSHTEHNVGRTVMDALKLAFTFGSSSDNKDGSHPNADKVFERYDKSPDSLLSARESRALLQDLGFTEEEVKQMQSEMDTDHDGYINKAEFNDYIQVPEPEAQAPGTTRPAAEAAPREEPSQAAPAAREPEPVVEMPEQPAVPAHQEPLPPTYPMPELAPPPAAPALPEIKPWKPPVEMRNVPPPEPPSYRDIVGRSLQSHAARTQDTLVDAFENAQLAEIKRSVFRSLGRLRSAQIKEYDTVARLETQAIDQYNDHHSYRAENPLHHLSDLEEPVSSDKFATFHSGAGPSDED